MGLVQARWGHLNAQDSLLTQAQAIGIDGHFMVEQSARTFSGLLMNFNGTAGIWRRKAIVAAGGWSADTLTEDLDLSYRAQLAGWRTHFLADLEVPAELPTGVAAFKSQQFRWAKGSIQTACKLLPRIGTSDFSPWVKLQAALHLTHYVVHPLMLTVALLTLPAIFAFHGVFSPPVKLLLCASMLVSMLAPNALYVASQRALYPDWRRRLRRLPLLTCVGVGLALSNSRAVFEALAGMRSDFVRTPKRGERDRQHYRVRSPMLPWLELALGAYCAVGLALYVHAGKLFLGPFLFIYAAGFLMIGGLGLREQRVTALSRPVAAPDDGVAKPAASGV